MKPAVTLAALIFTVVACAHILRLIYGWQVTIGSMTIPMWVSIAGVIIPAILAVLLWKESSRS